MIAHKLTTDIVEVERLIDLIQWAFDELAIVPHIISDNEAESIVCDVARKLKKWNKPGNDNVFAAWHFKCLAYHILCLLQCKAMRYDLLEYANRYLGWALTFLQDELEGLEGLLEIQNMSQ